jgi:leukotriene-A4 hydrolase
MAQRFRLRLESRWAVGLVSLLVACSQQPPPVHPPERPLAPEPVTIAKMPATIHDTQTFSRPEEVAVDHLNLELSVDFTSHRLTGRATYRLVHHAPAPHVVLDTRDLDIRRVTVDGAEAHFRLSDEVRYLGRALEIELPASARSVSIDYSTRPGAEAVQWLSPEQAGSGSAFLYTQSETTMARTWVPCQDTPGVRMTYDATIRVPPQFLALMSAENPTAKRSDGVYRFHMPQAVPSYLLALAVGDLSFHAFDNRSGVYALPTVIERAAWELADTPKMIGAAEQLYGPYRWGRYDLLILPASYPLGGMENPRLTFATPTILAGDRSLVSLVAHELAHSWSGNLVTNATWSDFWLNEGFTVYVERRIMEALSGKDTATMLAVLGRHELDETIAELGAESPDTRLVLDINGRDPETVVSRIAYEKGALFLTTIEASVGRPRFDAWLRSYFDHFAFQSIETAQFLDYLNRQLLDTSPGLAGSLRLDAWIHGTGVPSNAVVLHATPFTAVDHEVAAFRAGKSAAELSTSGWNTQQWLRFLLALPETLSLERMADLDATFHFTTSANSEILSTWLLRCVDERYRAADPALQEFLTHVGRRKMVKPLYQALARTPAGTEAALRIYAEARPLYHAMTRNAIDQLLDWRPENVPTTGHP